MHFSGAEFLPAVPQPLIRPADAGILGPINPRLFDSEHDSLRMEKKGNGIPTPDNQRIKETCNIGDISVPPVNQSSLFLSNVQQAAWRSGSAPGS